MSDKTASTGPTGPTGPLYGGGSGGDGTPRRATGGGGAKRGRGGSLLRGDRPMKEYYVYDSEFRELKRTGVIATTLFALGSACMGFVVNTHLAIVFADKLSDQIKIEWTTYRNIGFMAALVFYFFGVMQALTGYNEVERIKTETSHDGEKYKPKSRFKVAFWALAFTAIFVLGFIVRQVWL
jgi:hypothetical protein